MDTNDEIIVYNKDLNIDKQIIYNLIHVVRDKQVMLDCDLAMLYRAETKNLNKAMKRNQKRFPEDFCFQLTEEEYTNLKSQIATSSSNNNEIEDNTHGGRRKLPYVYTEQGIAMLSAVLRSDVAIQVSIRIMKTFVDMRKYLAKNSMILEKVNNIEQRQIQTEIRRDNFEKYTDERFDRIFDYIETHKENNQKIFFDGQIFDAFSLITQLVRQADKDIILIDGYVDVRTLNILSKKKEGVGVVIYTFLGSKLTDQDITNFNAQYPMLNVKRTNVFHDRFLIIDGITGYHIGASIKDAGKKCFGINRIEDVRIINELIRKAKITN